MFGILELLDVSFRYSRYCGLTHQNVKISRYVYCHISQIFPFNSGEFFKAVEDILHPLPPHVYTVLGGWAVVYTVGKLSSQSTYVPRVTQCLFPRPYWDLLPTPSPASECILPFRTGGGGHPPLCVRGVGPNSDDCRECIALCLCCGWQTLAGTHFLRSQEIHTMLVDCKTYWLSTEIYERRRQNWQINFSINRD
jgi:hypothetical protein